MLNGRFAMIQMKNGELLRILLVKCHTPAVWVYFMYAQKHKAARARQACPYVEVLFLSGRDRGDEFLH